MTATSSQGRGSRPGPLTCERGNTSVEVAGGLMAISALVVLVFQVMAIVGCEFGLAAGSRTAARAASIAPDRASAIGEVRTIAARAGASGSLSDDANYVTVTLTDRKSTRLNSSH